MTNKELVQQSFADFTTGNIPAILDRLSDDISWEMNGPELLPFAGKRNGKQEVLDFFVQLANTSDFHEFTPHEYIAEDDKVAAFGIAVTTNKLTGKRSSNNWAMYWAFSNGKITAYRNYSDTWDLAQSFTK